MTARHTLYTIGYERTTPALLLEALTQANVAVLVDVRAVASSRRPGFAKKALAAHLAEAGVEYLHLRGLGTPAAGRVAARAGRHAEMHQIFRKHLKTTEALDDLDILIDLVESGRHAALLCLEAEPVHCHRSLVAAAVGERIDITVVHLAPTLV